MSKRIDPLQPTPFSTPPVQFQATSARPLTDVWADAQRAFQQARAISPLPTSGQQEYFYGISDRIIHLSFAGASLASLLTPALAHLATAPHPAPDLTVKLWDKGSTGVALPPLPATMQQPLSADEQWGSHAHSERFHAFLQPRYPLLTMLDRQAQEAIYWVDDADQLPLTEGGAPLLTLLHWWLGGQARQIVHGAAVGTDAGAVLLVGKSGSGKSTTALACLHAGLHYLGDDYCLVATTPQPTVYSLYSSGKVHFADLARFPRFQAAQSANRYTEADKALYFFAAPFADQIVPSLPLKAILVPTICGAGQSRLQAVSPATALLALAPSTIFQLVGEKQQTLQQLGQLVRQLPCYRLALGPELDAIPALIGDLLAKG